MTLTAGSSLPPDEHPTLKERSGGWWEVTYWPWFFNRNQAITALTVTELLESSHDSNAPLVAALQQELLTGPLSRLAVTAPVTRAPGAIGPDRLARSRQT